MEKGVVRPKGIQGMLYGNPGVGKTTVLSQMPKPAAILDVEGGTGWLRAERDLEGLTIYRLSDREKAADSVEAFLKDAAAGRGEPAKFASIGIDSVSSLRSQHLTELTEGELHIEQGDYGKSTTWLRRVLTLGSKIRKIVIWTTTVKEVRDGPRIVLRPGGLSDTAVAHCLEIMDFMVFMSRLKKGGENEITISRDDVDPVAGRMGVLVKDRTGILTSMEFPGLSEDGTPPPMFEPFFSKVLETLQKEQANGPSGS